MCLMETVAVRCVGSGQTCPPYIARVVSVWESKTHDGPILLCCRKAQCLLLCQAEVPCTLQGFYFLFLFFSRVFPKAPEGDPPCSKLYSLHLLGQKPCSMHRRRADAQPSTDAHHQVGAVLGCTPCPLLPQHPGVAPPAPKVSCRQKKGGKNVGSRGQDCICGAVVAAAYRSVGAGSGRAGRDEFSSTLIYLLLSEPAQRAGRNSKPEKFLVFFSKHLPEKDAKLNATSKNIRTKQIF